MFGGDGGTIFDTLLFLNSQTGEQAVQLLVGILARRPDFTDSTLLEHLYQAFNECLRMDVGDMLPAIVLVDFAVHTLKQVNGLLEIHARRLISYLELIRQGSTPAPTAAQYSEVWEDLFPA
jgi:hypothetical protein